MRKGKAAGQFAINRVKSESFPGMCKQNVRQAFDVPSKSADAHDCWANTKHKIKPKNINDTPAFVPAYFKTGGHDHVVITIGKDKQGRRLCVSTDVQDSDHDGRKEIGIVPLEKLVAWGPYLGYGLDMEGVMVADKPAAPAKKAPAKKAAPKPSPPAATHPNSGNPVVKPKPQAPKSATRKTVNEIAQEVVDGKWGNGADRKLKLERAGYPYAAVQHAVNDLLN